MPKEQNMSSGIGAETRSQRDNSHDDHIRRSMFLVCDEHVTTPGPSATLSTKNPTCPDPGLNPGRRGGKPATNRLSYGAAQVD
jgi:hypothetical protein